MKNKPKFNKSKCLKCKYHGLGCGGYTVRRNKSMVHVYCNYAFINDMTCLQPGPRNTTIDLRGDDYDNCKLFVEGKVENVKQQICY